MDVELFSKLQAVRDEQSLLEFVRALKEDRAVAESAPQTQDGFQGEWANGSTAAFLEAGIAWAEDSSFGARPGPKPDNPWALFAQFLWAGRIYE